MSGNNGESFTPATANVVNDDPLGMTERKISRAQDDIANAEMFGDEVADAQKQELKGLEDMRDYLESRDYKDQSGNIHDANNGQFKSLENANQKPENPGERYEDRPLDSLIKTWAEANHRGDKNTGTSIQDEVLRRVVDKQDKLDDNQKQHIIDLVQKRLMDYSNAMYPAGPEINEAVAPEQSDLDIDTTVPGAEGHRNDMDDSNEADIEVAAPVVVETPAANTNTNVPDNEIQPIAEVPVVNESDGKLKAALTVNIEDNIRRAAENSARHQIEADKTTDDRNLEGKSKFRKAINGMLRGITLSHRERTYRVEAERKLRENLDFIEQSVPAEARAQAKQDLFNQFKSGIEGSIRDSKEVGEKRKELEDTHELAIGTKDLISRYHRGEFRDDGAFEEARVRMIEDYRKSHPEEAKDLGINKKAAEISDLIEIAKTAAGMVEHGESIDNILQNMSIVVGEARSDVNSQAKLNAVEKLYDKLSRSKIGSCVPGVVMLTGISMGMSFGRYGGQSAISSATKLGVVSFAAGLFAGAKKNMEYKKARAGQQIDEAKGETYDRDRDELRSKMEEFSLRPESAKSLTDNLNDLASNDKLESGSDAVKNAIGALADLEAKMKYSDKAGRDFLAFSNPAAIIKERLDLVKSIAQAKSNINRYITPEMRNEMGVGVDDNMQQIVDKLSVDIVETLDTNLTNKDKAFNKLKRQEVTKAAIKGVVVGATLGVIMQEVGAAFDNTRVGLLEQLWHAKNVASNGEFSKTLLAGAFGGTDIAKNVDVSNVAFANTNIGEHATYGISGNGNSIVDHGNGTIDIVGHDGRLAENIPVNADGSMSAETINNLRNSGLDIIDKSTNIDHVTEVTKTIGGNEFVDKHIGEMTKIHRLSWMDNDTEKYDYNELKTWWGGDDNNGITPEGYQLKVPMTAEGSFHDGEVLNAPELIKNGQLQAVISASRETQGEGFILPIDRDGNLNIDANSPVAKLFSIVDGKAHFNGGFVEIVKVDNVDADGVPGVKILSTLEGGNDASIEVTEKITEHVFTPAYEIVPQQVEMPPVVFTESREQMGRTKAEYASPETETPITYGYGYESAQQRAERDKKWENERSDRLKDNPNAKLNPKEELDDYKKKQSASRGEGYIKEIDSRIDSDEVLKDIGSNTKVIVNIPVGAAQESENIYNSLSLYAQQGEESKAGSVILLNVNWKESDKSDPQKSANIQKTIQEINRAKADFPDLRIASFEKEWSNEWLSTREDGAMYGEVIKSLYDTGALAVQRAMENGKMEASQDVLIITNDADAIGMDRRYLGNFINAESKYPDQDAFIGGIRWGSEIIRKFPGYHTSQLFMQAMNMLSTKLAPGMTATIGPNSAFRLSMYAAINGCEDGNDIGVGADSILGRKVLAARGISSQNGGYEDSSDTNLNIKNGGRRKVIQQVLGTDIDSSGERLLDKGYRKVNVKNPNGVFLSDAWGGFNTGESRNSSSGESGLLKEEDLDNGFDEIKGRTEFQIEQFINRWYPSEQLASYCLGLLFPAVEINGGAEMSWSLSSNSDGKFSFKFTGPGAEKYKRDLLNKRALYEGKPFVVNKLVRPI